MVSSLPNGKEERRFCGPCTTVETIQDHPLSSTTYVKLATEFLSVNRRPFRALRAAAATLSSGDSAQVPDGGGRPFQVLSGDGGVRTVMGSQMPCLIMSMGHSRRNLASFTAGYTNFANVAAVLQHLQQYTSLRTVDLCTYHGTMIQQ